MAEPLDQPTFRLIKSQRGGDKLSESGFLFGVQGRVGDVTHWLCEQRGVCKARVHTKGMVVVKRTNEHSHGPDEQAADCYEAKAGMKRKARESQDSTHHIVGESLQTASEGTAAKLPKLDSLKRTIQRQCASILAAPAQPTTLAELALPAAYQQTAKGEQFLLYDSGADDVHRFLIFATQHNLGMLQRSKIWLADGTFKTAPPLFAQVYVVHGLRGGDDPMKTGHLLPSLFVLLPNKTEAAYLRMWEQIRLLCSLAQPQQMLLDFEKGAITSFEHVWPNTVVKCCFFHLTQNIWRHVQSVGLQSAYTHDEELAMRIRRIPALAFARPADVPDLFDQVAMDLPLTPEIGELVDYFERTYIGRTVTSGYHVAATYPIHLWNNHISTPLGLPRTTNAVEAWHRSFNATVGYHHPTIWKFILSLKREQGLVEVRHTNYLVGKPPCTNQAEVVPTE
ncbi:hypothetical protein LOD99_5517 [Oopsacas minuta]|uniref:MULE transposase domain-containing protein n=1 Tax=Oopsacas minuta TaxID=111878 RepID=A0AAV7JR16_9METZ|nr:hypothetical protein LOD99_5517 [Oopsacas minuta]